MGISRFKVWHVQGNKKRPVSLEITSVGLGRDMARQCEGSGHAAYYGHVRTVTMILGQQQNRDMTTLVLRKHDTGSRMEIWRMG